MRFSTLTMFVFGLAFVLAGCPNNAAEDDDDTSDGGPSILGVSAGDCEGNPGGGDGGGNAGTAVGVAAASSLDVQVNGTDLVVHLEDMDANCCPSPGAEVDVTDGLIVVEVEDVTADEACGCSCIMDFDVDVVDLEPGDYTVDVYFDGDFFDTAEITI